MKRRLKVPIRIKFMLTVLMLVTAVVGLIAFSTATLFREDKLTYVNGLTSMVTLGTAEEARSTLSGYRERLELYSRFLLQDSGSNQEDLSRTLFEEFPDLLAIQFRRQDEEPAGVFNMGVLESAGILSEDVARALTDVPVPRERIDDGASFVRNTPISPELPTFALTFRLQDAQDTEVTISALLRSQRLLQVVSRFSAYEQYLVDSEGNFLVHPDPQRMARTTAATLRPEAERALSDFSAGVTLEYDDAGTPMIGALAGVDVGNVLAASQIPTSAANLASRRVVSRVLLVAVLLLLAAVVVSVLWSHRLTRPMERLSLATQRIAQGDFTVQVAVESADELGDLAQSFNHMTGELTARELALQDAQQQLVQSEKMSAFGQLGAGIAHEVKNPLTGILACAQLAMEDVPAESSVHDDLKLIEKETKRCKAIIENLLKFARHEKSEMTETDVNAVIEDSIAIVNHQLELNEVRVERDLQAGLPAALGNANQLQQVFINLLINAQQAMSGSGKIRVVSRLEEDWVIRLRFIDTGPGIREEIRAKIFEPFYTTKPTGQGTGLGLSVSYGIIKDHNGEIEIESELGQGTTFTISLPLFDGAQESVGEVDAPVIVVPGTEAAAGIPVRRT